MTTLGINTNFFSHLLFSIVLIFSIVGPSISKLCNSEMQAIVIMDTSEEDKSGKSEKVVDEKILQNSTVYSKDTFFIQKKTGFDQYLDTASNYVSKILLPPPIHII